MNTVVVNLWAGPGTGKSTNAFLVAGKLKVREIEAELVHEYAKDLTWEERHTAIANQPYIMGKQQFHIERVMGKVQVIITDSPLPFGLIYKGDGYTEALGRHIIETFNRWNTLNIFLERDPVHHPYVEAGRSQTQEEAEEIDGAVLDLLDAESIPFTHIKIQEGEKTADAITAAILRHLEYPEESKFDG
jgi:hypothetical protein